MEEGVGSSAGTNSRSLDPKSTAPRADVPGDTVRRTLKRSSNSVQNIANSARRNSPSFSAFPNQYAGRTVADLKKRGDSRIRSRHPHEDRQDQGESLLRKRPKLRRPKEAKKGIEIDTVVRFSVAVKRYIYTAIDISHDLRSREAYESHSSKSAADFLRKLKEVAPFPVTHLQTDNGSEFAKYFSDACARAWEFR